MATPEGHAPKEREDKGRPQTVFFYCVIAHFFRFCSRDPTDLLWLALPSPQNRKEKEEEAAEVEEILAVRGLHQRQPDVGS